MAEQREDLAGPDDRLAALGEADGGEFVAEEDVFGDGEPVDDVEFLVHGGDAEAERLDGAGDPHLHTLKGDGARVWLVRPGEHLDQS